MASRTNKQGIAKKKVQQQKQANRTKGSKRFEYPKRKLTLEEGKEQGIIWGKSNPKGHEYNRFLRGRKICWETKIRIDPDGYRYIKTPSGGSEMVQAPSSGWVRVKLNKMVYSHSK